MADGRGPAAQSVPRPILEMSDEACSALLGRQRLCIVALWDGEPYAVPVYYGWNGEALYLGLAEGRKTRALAADPRVHVVVTETGPGSEWRSVAVAGTVRFLTDHAERARGLEVLTAHNRRVLESAGEAPPAPQRAHAGGHVVKVEAARITGRTRG